jgi:hypothetical protein
MGIFSFNSKRVNKKDHLGKRQSLMWSITLAGYRRQVGDLVQMKADAKKSPYLCDFSCMDTGFVLYFV